MGDPDYPAALASFTSDFPDMEHGNPYAVPTLDFDDGWTNAHDITGNDFVAPPGNAQGNPTGYNPVTGQAIYPDPNAAALLADPPDPGVVPFSVDLDGIQEGLDVILHELKPAVATYTEFKDWFKSVEDWVFLTPSEPDSELLAYVIQTNDSDGSSSSSEHNNARQGVVAVETTLAAIGSSLDIVGEFVGRVNDAAQSYKHADNQSFGNSNNAQVAQEIEQAAGNQTASAG